MFLLHLKYPIKLLLGKIATEAIAFTHVLGLSAAFLCNLLWNAKVVTDLSPAHSITSILTVCSFIARKSYICIFFWNTISPQQPPKVEFSAWKDLQEPIESIILYKPRGSLVLHWPTGSLILHELIENFVFYMPLGHGGQGDCREGWLRPIQRCSQLLFWVAVGFDLKQITQCVYMALETF